MRRLKYSMIVCCMMLSLVLPAAFAAEVENDVPKVSGLSISMKISEPSALINGEPAALEIHRFCWMMSHMCRFGKRLSDLAVSLRQRISAIEFPARFMHCRKGTIRRAGAFRKSGWTIRIICSMEVYSPAGRTNIIAGTMGQNRHLFCRSFAMDAFLSRFM